jgi:HAD superfamily hydrolase (TIGR01509 family)
VKQHPNVEERKTGDRRREAGNGDSRSSVLGLPSPEIAAVIFDMDGLMLDTERIAGIAWQRALADWNYPYSEQLFLKTVGRTSKDTEAIYQAAFGPEFPSTEIGKRTQQYYIEYIAAHGVGLKSGLLGLLELLEGLNVPRGVASSTKRPLVIQKLTMAGILERFDAIVGGDEIRFGKPAPDIFLAISRRLQAPPYRCLVLEDSEAGVQAARAAGMMPILVPDLVQPSAETTSLAHRVLPSLDDVRLVLQDHFNLQG